MKILRNETNLLKQRKNTYCASVALLALLCAASASRAMEAEGGNELPRIRCLWNLEKKSFRASALEILEKKVLNGPFQTNPKMRINYLKKLSEFLKENSAHILNLEILNSGRDTEETPLSKFYNDTLAHIMQSSLLPEEKGLQALKAKIFYSRLPYKFTQLNSEDLNKIKNETNEIATDLVVNRQISKARKDYLNNFYPTGNPEISDERLKKRDSLALECCEPLLKGKINFKVALSKIENQKKIGFLESAKNYPLAQYYLAALYAANGSLEDAFELCSNIVDNENLLKPYPLAAYKLAKFYETGFIDGDFRLKAYPEKALDYLKEAAQQGHPYAQYELVNYFISNREIEQGIDYLLQSAEGGYSSAQLLLAQKFEQGDGDIVNKNLSEASKWYKKAADQGEEEAYYSLGHIYEDSKDDKNAISFYTKSKDPRAYVRLGEIYLKDIEGQSKNTTEAIKCFRNAADQGNADGDYYLGLMDLRGVDDGTPNFPAALEKFEAASKKDHAKALFQLGVMKQFGIGTNQSYAEAKTFYERAAKKGHPQATYELGCLYIRGLSEIEQDKYVVSLKLWEEAAGLGYAKAAYKAGKGYLNIWSHTKDETSAQNAKKYLGQAADARHTDSLYWLGRMHELGTVVEKNPTKAIENYEKAANVGHASAQFNLGMLYAADPEQKDKAFGWFESAAKQYHVEALRVLQEHYFKVNDLNKHFEITKTLSKHLKLRNINRSAKKGHRESIQWLKEESDKANPVAQRYYGKLLETGVVHAQNGESEISIHESLGLYGKASKENHKAKHRLDELVQALGYSGIH